MTSWKKQQLDCSVLEWDCPSLFTSINSGPYAKAHRHAPMSSQESPDGMVPSYAEKDTALGAENTEHGIGEQCDLCVPVDVKQLYS